MRPPFSFRVQQAIAIDDFVVPVFEQRKIDFSTALFFEQLDQFPRLVMRVDTCGHEVGVVVRLFVQ